MSTPDPLKNAANTVLADAQKVAAEVPVVEAQAVALHTKAVAFVVAHAGKIVTVVMALVGLAVWKFL